MRIACIVPTYNGRNDLFRLYESLKKQVMPFDFFIVDSSSTDGTTELATSIADVVKIISPEHFNHGGTRQLLVSENIEYDYYIFLTQDAYLEDCFAFSKIIAPFEDPLVGAVCGRQLPHSNATLFARHARYFNYPDAIQVKSLVDAAQLGIKTPFMSNSFSAYRRNALIDVGGFPDNVICTEDMYVAAKMLLSGWKIAYAGDAACRHSHNYSISEEFSRYFDIGVFHARESWIKQSFGGAGGEGFRFVISEFKFLGKSKLHLFPSLILRNLAKFIAFQLGANESYLPIFLKRKLSMQKRYWDGLFAIKC